LGPKHKIRKKKRENVYNLFTPNIKAMLKTAKNTVLEYVFNYGFIESSWLFGKHRFTFETMAHSLLCTLKLTLWVTLQKSAHFSATGAT